MGDAFIKGVEHRALWVHHFGRVALVRGKNFAWGVSALFLTPGFPCFLSTSSMTASSVTSIFEESCFGLWSIASSHCPCLRESICACKCLFLPFWAFCHLLEFFTFFLPLSIFHFSDYRWCVDNALIKGEIEEWAVLTPGYDEWIVNRAVWSCAWSLVTSTRASSVDEELPWRSSARGPNLPNY